VAYVIEWKYIDLFLKLFTKLQNNNNHIIIEIGIYKSWNVCNYPFLATSFAFYIILMFNSKKVKTINKRYGYTNRYKFSLDCAQSDSRWINLTKNKL
jgi:hypothetical protein